MRINKITPVLECSIGLVPIILSLIFRSRLTLLQLAIVFVGCLILIGWGSFQLVRNRHWSEQKRMVAGEVAPFVSSLSLIFLELSHLEEIGFPWEMVSGGALLIGSIANLLKIWKTSSKSEGEI